MNTERWNTTSIDVNKSGSNGRNFCKLVSLRPSSTKLQCTSRKKVTIVQVNVGSSQTLTFLHRVFLNVSSLTLFFTPTPGLFSTFTLLFFFTPALGFSLQHRVNPSVGSSKPSAQPPGCHPPSQVLLCCQNKL